MNAIKNTPVVELKGYPFKLYLKNEMVQPTGTHKDRESEIIIEDIKKKNLHSCGCASTGNAAISLSAFAKASKIKCKIYMPSSTTEEKLGLIRKNDAELIKIDADYGKVVDISNKEMKNIYNANPGFCKIRPDGDKQIGMEIAELEPTIVICPTNNGTHLAGVWSGLKEKNKKPRMIAAIAKKSGLATSIAGFYQKDKIILEKALNESNGKIIDLCDDEIEAAIKELHDNGVFCEPASAATLAAMKKMNLRENDIVVLTITGADKKHRKLQH